ncbi:IscS subfamily cysteine desulfurase [Candidatus Fokinia solitaria]|nr:IscS subfamily cysteine desulfurase [Candidatus Fokinia solitaria]
MTAKKIYMDYQATTPTDPRVLQAMLPFFSEKFGNPHSRSHAFGWESESAVEDARSIIANAINASHDEIIFTSGATESNNIALKGVARFYSKNFNKNHIITPVTEHKCILDSCRTLEDEGIEVTYLPVENDGMLNLDTLKKAIKANTALVSVMMVNNEIGVIQQIKSIGEICRERGVIFHTDAAQAFCKIPIDVRDMCIDMLSISGHKIYGPKGVGALFVGKHPTRVRLQPMMSGGGQERGMRSGTLPTPLIVGLGEATKCSIQDMQKDYAHVSLLGKQFIQEMLKIPHVILNGSLDARYPGCINLSFAYVEGESLILALKDIAVSSGSACTSNSLEPSYVVQALGGDKDLAHSSIRFGFGRFTTQEEVDITIRSVKNAVSKLREMSPLWDMVQDGVDLSSINWKSDH